VIAGRQFDEAFRPVTGTVEEDRIPGAGLEPEDIQGGALRGLPAETQVAGTGHGGFEPA